MVLSASNLHQEKAQQEQLQTLQTELLSSRAELSSLETAVTSSQQVSLLLPTLSLSKSQYKQFNFNLGMSSATLTNIFSPFF